MPKGIDLTVSFRVIRAFQNTISAVIISESCDTNLNTLIGSIFHEPALWTDLDTRMSGRISKSLRYNRILTFISANSWEVICESILGIRIAGCNTFSCDVLAVRVSCWGAYVDAHCGQRVTPVFCSFSSTVITSLYANLRNLTAKVSIRTCVRASFSERIRINRLIPWASSNTQSSQVISIWIYRTFLNTLVSRVVSPVFLRTILDAPSCPFISITEIRSGNRRVCCHIRTSTDTLSGWGVCKVPRSLAIELTHTVLVIVIGHCRASEDTLVSRIIGTWETAGVANVHANSVTVVGEWINTIIHTSIGPVICIKGRDTSWVADSCVGVGIETSWTYLNTNSFSACLVEKSISICMNWTSSHTNSCRWVSITLRTYALTDWACSVIEPERS